MMVSSRDGGVEIVLSQGDIDSMKQSGKVTIIYTGEWKHKPDDGVLFSMTRDEFWGLMYDCQNCAEFGKEYPTDCKGCPHSGDAKYFL